MKSGACETGPTRTGKKEVAAGGSVVTTCDICRTRKVKCKRDVPLPPGFDPRKSDVPPCNACLAFSVPCSYEYVAKKPGPLPKFKAKLFGASSNPPSTRRSPPRDSGEAVTASSASYTSTPIVPGSSADRIAPSTSTLTSTSNLDFGPSALSPSFFLPPIASTSRSAPSPSSDSSFAFPSPPNFGFTLPTSNDRTSPYSFSNPNSLFAAPSSSTSPAFLPPISSFSTGSPSADTSNLPPFALPATRTSPSSTYDAGSQSSLHTQSTGGFGKTLVLPIAERIEDVVPREIALEVFSIFFDFIWPLYPCIHRPSFTASVANREDESSPLFLALCLTTLAFTFSQVPSSLVPFDPAAVSSYSKQAILCIRALLMNLEETPSLQLLIVHTFLASIAHNHNRHALAWSSRGQTLALVLQLRLREEATYETLDPISAQLARRIMHVLYGGDKTVAIIKNGAALLSPDQFEDIGLPAELDEDLITSAGCGVQPSGRTPILAGFGLNSRLFLHLGRIVQFRREVARSPISDLTSLLPRITSIHGMMEETFAILRSFPPELTLRQDGFDSRQNSPEPDWAGISEAQLYRFFAEPSSPNSRNTFLVLQANLYVTLAFLRFYLIQYQDDLLACAATLGESDRFAAQSFASTLDSKKAVSLDLLTALHMIPIECIASSGPSLVMKVRYVAASLLETQGTDDAALSRSTGYLWSFLKILGAIETRFAEQQAEL